MNKLFAFLKSTPVWLQTLGPERLAVCLEVPKSPFPIDAAHVFTLDLSDDRWQLVLRNPLGQDNIDAKPADVAGKPGRSDQDRTPPPGLRMDQPRYPGEHVVLPPYAAIDDWLWCFSPLCRISPDGKRTEEFPELETNALRPRDPRFYTEWTAYLQFPGAPNSLIYLPERRWLLYGCRESLWVLELPPAETASTSP